MLLQICYSCEAFRAAFAHVLLLNVLRSKPEVLFVKFHILMNENIHTLRTFKIVRRTLVDASVFQWEQIKTRKLYPSPQFSINNTEYLFTFTP